MSNDFYSATVPAARLTTGRAAPVNAVPEAVEAAFDLLPGPDAIQGNAHGYAAATGSAGAYTAIITPWPADYANGQTVRLLVNHVNPGGGETFSPNGMTPKPIRDQDGAELEAGVMPLGAIVTLTYVTNRWQLFIGEQTSDVTQVTADSEVIRPEDFATGTDGGNLAAAFAQGIATGTPVRLDGAYSISAALSTVAMTTGVLNIIGSGSITVTADMGAALTFHATYPTAVSVSAVVQTTRALPGVSTTVGDVTKITAAGHGCAVGDIIKIVSDDQISPQSAVDHRRGEFAYVADVSGNDLYVAGYLLETYTTTIRLVRVRKEPRLIWDGPTFAATAGQSWDVIFLRVRGFVQPKIRTGFREGYHIGLDLSSCVMPDVDVECIRMLNRVTSEGIAGYLVQDTASWMSQVRVRGIDARHAYTTVSPTSTTSDNAYLYGRTIGAIVSGAVVAASSSAFDVHTEAVDVTFANVTTGGGWLGEAAAAAGIQLRGLRTRAINCVDRGSANGAQFYAQVAGDCVDCELVNFNYLGLGDGIRINDGTSTNAARPKVKGGLIRTSKIRSVVAWDCDGGVIDDLTIAPTGSTNGTTGILLNVDADLLVRRLTIDLAGYTGTQFRAFGFGGAGNSLLVESARVINASGKFQAWFHGNSEDGTAVLGGLSSDAAPTSTVLGAEALDSLVLSDGWSLIEAWTYASDVTEKDFVDIGFDEVMVVARGVTKQTTGTLNLRVSTNNGSSFKTASGDYVSIDAAGVETAATGMVMHATNATLARSCVAVLSGLRNNQFKAAQMRNAGTTYTIDTTTPVNALRVYPGGGGNLTGGVITLLGR